MRTAFRLTAAAAGLALLAGCAQSGESGDFGFNKSTGGGLLGGIGGAVAGSQFGKGKGRLAATAAGTLLGAVIGSEVGRSLDRADRVHAGQARSRAGHAPVGETIAWSNPESGNRGRITPTREGRSETGEYCREFQEEIQIGGRTERGYGVACRQPDGSWRIVQ